MKHPFILTLVAICLTLLGASMLPGVCGGAPPAPPPDQLLLTKAKDAIAKNNTETAIASLEALRKQFPAGAVTSQGDVLLDGLYLAAGDAEHAKAISIEVFTNWPNSDAAWSVLEATCNAKVKTSLQDAFNEITTRIQNKLPPKIALKAIGLRLSYLEKLHPDDFISEAMNYYSGLDKKTANVDALTFLVNLTPSLYHELFLAKRGKDAASVSDALQNKI